jgi:4a-hydroxytetrahydrobiopterin dehydratase
MTERISVAQFVGRPGVQDWRVIFGGSWACAYFRTGSFAAGVALVAAIGELAGDHPPDVDLRPEGVSVRLFDAGAQGVTDREVELARQISQAAGRLGLAADPGRVQHVQVAVDVLDIAAAQLFWQAILGYQLLGDADVADPLRRGPTFWLQQLDAPRPQRNRIHIDVYLPADEVQGRIEAALAAGGRIVDDAHAPGWWTLADPEGNEVDLAIWD